MTFKTYSTAYSLIKFLDQLFYKIDNAGYFVNLKYCKNKLRYKEEHVILKWSSANIELIYTYCNKKKKNTDEPSKIYFILFLSFK